MSKTKLNEIEILWYYKNLDVLEKLVAQALDSWNRRKETKDHIPEFLILHPSTKIDKESIEGLEIKFEHTVQKGHFKIRGTIY